MGIETVFSLVGLLILVGSSLFGVFLNLSAKIDRSYERMDENKEQFYDDFLLITTHETSVKYVKDLYEEKHAGLETLLKERLDNLANEIKQLREIISKKSK